MVNRRLFLLLSAFVAVTVAMPMHQPNSKGEMSTVPSTHQHKEINQEEIKKIALVLDKLSNKAGKAIEMEKHPTPQEDVTGKKRLDFRITNVHTRKEERYNPAKHYFHPEEHHPDVAKKALEVLRKEKDPRWSDIDYVKKMQSLSAKHDGALHASSPNGAVLDYNKNYIYSHRLIGPEQALEKLDKGTVKKMKLRDDGNVDLHMSDVELKEHLERQREAYRDSLLPSWKKEWKKDRKSRKAATLDME